MVMGMVKKIKGRIYAANQMFSFFLEMIWCKEDDDDRDSVLLTRQKSPPTLQGVWLQLQVGN